MFEGALVDDEAQLVVSVFLLHLSHEVIALLEVAVLESRVVVAGVNRHKWHVKPTQNEPGHIVDREAPIHVSNVALIDPKTKKATRAGYKMEGDKKVRVSKKSGAEI